MTRINLPPGDGEELYRFWAINPDITGPATALSGAVYISELVSVRTRELMRKRIAEINFCAI
jgi:alkylhydroperoxidase family enzyme